MERLIMIASLIGLHLDSKYSAVLEKQLDYVKTKVYEILYPGFKARQLIPVSHDAPASADTITYETWDSFGMAQIITNYANALPLIEALADSTTVKVKGIGAAYQYTIMDLRAAAQTGSRLEQKKARFTRRACELMIETIGAVGHAAYGLTGLANNPNVSLVAPATGNWSVATVAQIRADLDILVLAVATATKNVFPPTTIALPFALYNILATKIVSTTGDTNRTLMQDFIAANPWVTEIEAWDQLALADAAGTGPRIVAYHKDPEVLSLEIPQEYEQLPPQPVSLSFVINTHARCAGVLIPFPLGVAYMDGC